MSLIESALTTLVEGLRGTPAIAVSELDVLPPSARHRVTSEWNATAVAHRTAACLHELFEAHAERAPDAIAVAFEDEVMSYRALNERANRLAHHLRHRGVGPDDRVAICVDRGFDAAVAVLATLKSGAGYVPSIPRTRPRDWRTCSETARPPWRSSIRSVAWRWRI